MSRNMNLSFIFEDGNGNVVDENGVSPIDIVDDNDIGAPVLESLTTFGIFQEQVPHTSDKQDMINSSTGKGQHISKNITEKKNESTSKREYNKHSDDVKRLVIEFYLEKLCSAAEIGRAHV